MNAPFVVAQAVTSGQGITNPPAPARIIKVVKPQGEQAVVFNLDSNTRLDVSAIAAEKITLVRVGNRLVILFDNNTSVTIEPFFDANGQPLPVAGIDLDGTRIVTPEQFAAIFPIGDDQSILPATGPQGSPQNTGGQFATFTIQDLVSGAPLDLLGNDDNAFGAFTPTDQLPFLDDAVILPSSGGLTVLFDDEGLPGGNPDGVGDDVGGVFASGTLPHDFGSGGVGTLSFSPMHGVSQVIGGVQYDFTWNAGTGNLTISVSGVAMIEVTLNQTTGAFTATLLNPLQHPLADEDNLLLNLTYLVTNTTHNLSNTGTLTLNIDDDTPEIGDPRAHTVDEDWWHGNVHPEGANGDAAFAYIWTKGSLDIAWGADNANPDIDANGGIGDRSVVFAGIATGDVVQKVNGRALTSDGATVRFLKASDTDVFGFADANNNGQFDKGDRLVFRVQLSDLDDGSYRFWLFDNVDHRDNGLNDENDVRLSFDFLATDSDGDTTSGAFIVRVDDDTPKVLGPAENDRVHEDALPFDIGDLFNIDDACGCSVVRLGSLNISWGADRGSDRHIKFSGNGPIPDNLPDSLTSDGVPVKYAVFEGSNGSDVLVAYKDQGAGFTDYGNWVFGVAFVEAGLGTYVYVQFGNLDHLDANGKPIGRIPLDFKVIATDSDGDSVTQDFRVRVIDDVPYAAGAYLPHFVEEEELQGGNDGFAPGGAFPDGDTPWNTSITTETATGFLNIDWGSDDANLNVNGGFTGMQVAGDRSVVFGRLNSDDPVEISLQRAGRFVSVSGGSGNNGGPIDLADLTSGGKALKFFLSQNGRELIAQTEDGDPVFTVTLNDIGVGSFRFELQGVLDHPVSGTSPYGEDLLTLTFTYTARDGDGDRAQGEFVVNIIDDSPQAGPVAVGIVDEDGLFRGNDGDTYAAGSPQGGTAADAAGKAIQVVGDLNIAWGADNTDRPDDIALGIFQRQDGVVLTDTAPNDGMGRAVWFTNNTVMVGGDPSAPQTLTSRGDPVTFDLLDSGTRIVGTAGGRVVLTAVLSDDGSGQYCFTLLDELDHPSWQVEDDITLTFGITARDSDGDIVTSSFTVRINDDAPTIGSPHNGTVDEDGNGVIFVAGPLPGRNPGGNDDDSSARVVTGGSLDVDWGADDGINRTLRFDGIVNGAQATHWDGPLSSGGNPVKLWLSADGMTLYGYTGDYPDEPNDAPPAGLRVFTVVLSDSLLGQNYTFVLHKALDHQVSGTEDELVLNFDFVATDHDGDTAHGQFSVTVDDDTPTAVKDESVLMDEGSGVASGNVLDNDIQGADGATLTHVTFNGGSDWHTVNATGTTTIQITGVGTYTFDALGNWTFTPEQNFHGQASFAYIITDGDGDTSDPAVTIDNTVEIVINPVNDAPVVTGGDLSGSVKETGDIPVHGNGLTSGGLVNEAGPSGPLDTRIGSLHYYVPALVSAATTLPEQIKDILPILASSLSSSEYGLAFALIWDALDTVYATNGPNDETINHAFVRLGIEYATYVKDGNIDPLLDVTAKYEADTDHDGIPQRQQSLHDNLLGNLTEAALNQRFGANPDLLNELKEAIKAVDPDLLTRPYYGGYQGDDPAAVRAWDAANGFASQAKGKITISDPDTGDVHQFTTSDVGVYGDFTIDIHTGEWTYTLDNSNPDVQALAKGNSVTETFTVTIADQHGASVQTSLVITITGANDAPVIEGGTASAQVFESAGSPTTVGTAGSVSFFDVDNGDTHTVSASLVSVNGSVPLTQQQIGALSSGTFSLAPGQTAGVADWTYEISRNAISFLNDDETVTLVYRVTVTDSDGAIDTKDVTITINGATNTPPSVQEPPVGFSLGEDGSAAITGLSVTYRTFDTGEGDDHLFVRNGGMDVQGGNGTDTLDFSLVTNPGGVRVDLGEEGWGEVDIGRDNAGRHGNHDFINQSFENMVGSNFDDELFGSEDADIFRGLGGNDTLHGNGGSDELWGGAGDDVLFGGSGVDTLWGDSGNDDFYFLRWDENGGAGPDIIMDFEAGDEIILDQSGFANLTLGSGELQFDSGRINVDPLDLSKPLIFDTTTSTLYYQHAPQSWTALAHLENGSLDGSQIRVI